MALTIRISLSEAFTVGQLVRKNKEIKQKIKHRTSPEINRGWFYYVQFLSPKNSAMSKSIILP